MRGWFLVTLTLLIFLCGCTVEEVDPSETVFKDYSKPSFEAKELKIINETKPVLNVEKYKPEPVVDDSDYLIGSINVQIFGEKKATSNVMPVIEDIIDDYDILGIQEVRDLSGTVIERLEAIPGYSVRFSPRLGRSTSKEQYIFLVSDRVGIGRCNTYPDPGDKYEREPYVCQFIIDGNNITIIQVHTKPTDATEEIRQLSNVVDWTKENFGRYNIFIVGDMNMDCVYFNSFELFGDYEVLIGNDEDTTVGRTDCAYDRILSVDGVDQRVLEAGVDKFEDETHGDQELVEAISDHYAVFMVFDKSEW